MRKLKIALSGTLEESMVCVNQDYLNAIWKAGAIPTLLMPSIDGDYINEVVETFDGFLFCGGTDIDPSYYGEEINGAKNICSARDVFEKALFDAAYKTGKPILGICRGMQVINVFLGGSLYQHIEGHVQSTPRSERTHSVKLEKSSQLFDLIGEEKIEVNTFHHQLVKQLAEGLAIDAMTDEGYIEAYHHTAYPFMLCVQWHPEAYYDYCDTSVRIFRAFIEACGKLYEQSSPAEKA